MTYSRWFTNLCKLPHSEFLFFFFQCTEHTSSLLLERGFSLPAVKVLLSGGHSEHYSKATAQLAAQEEVILVTMVGSVKLPIKDE